MIEGDGVELPGADGYRYFGAAKNLPKVRELFNKEAPEPPKVNRHELYKWVTYNYLGYSDDSELIKHEKAYEIKLQEKAILEESRKRQKIEVD